MRKSPATSETSMIMGTRPTIGMGGHLRLWSDKIPVTVIAIEGNRIILQEDKSHRIDTGGEAQSYEYERDERGNTHVANLRKDGMFHLSNGQKVSLGKRIRYHKNPF